MTQEFRDTGARRPGRESGGSGQPVALAIGDGREDWMLPEDAFLGAGCRLERAEGFAEAEESCALSKPDLVFMPLTLDGKLTTDQLRRCLSHQPRPVVVVVASNDQINTAAEAMRLGAYDCLFKPFSRSRLERTIEEAVKQLREAPPPPKPTTRASRPMSPRRRDAPVAKEHQISGPAQARSGIDGLSLARRGFVASSPRMQSVLEQAAAVATSDAPVFISGEVGTGKTTLAGILHELSPRARQPLVTLTCAILTAAEFEDRVSGPHGALARAAGGTLYFDEVVDLPADVQPKVLRLIERAETGASSLGVRVIASTSHEPNAALKAGLIRPDLYYRLHVAPISLPPLRARDGDPALIARVRLAEFSEIEERGFVGYSDTALAMISGYDWPGNLRELINVVWTVVLMNQGPLVTPDLLPAEVRAGLRTSATGLGRNPAPAVAPPAATGADTRPEALVGKTLAEIERAVIEATIRAEGGSVPRAARVLDVSPSTLYRKREAWTKREKR